MAYREEDGRRKARSLCRFRLEHLREEKLLVELIADVEAVGPALSAVAVDIPIGLVAAPARQADLAARAFVGPRRSSVFPAPHPEVVHLIEYDEVNRSLVALRSC